MRKNFITSAVLSAIMLFSVSAFAATPDAEKAFVDSYKKAFESKDAATLESFLYTKGADPEALEFYKLMMTADMGATISKIELRNLTPEEVKNAGSEMPGLDGGKSKLPVMPSKKLVISSMTTGENGSSNGTSESFVAEIEGKLMIPVPVAVK